MERSGDSIEYVSLNKLNLSLKQPGPRHFRQARDVLEHCLYICRKSTLVVDELLLLLLGHVEV